jgi:hypothetical protein
MTDLSSIFGGAAPAPAPAPATQPAPAPALSFGGTAAPSWLTAIAAAEVVNRGADYMGEGTVIGKITQLKHIRKDDGGDALALEFEVIESLSPGYTPGQRLCCFRDIPGYRGMGAADFKTWITSIVAGIAASHGMPAPEVTLPVLQSLIGEQLAGHVIKVQGTGKPTEKGGTFTRYTVEYVRGPS